MLKYVSKYFKGVIFLKKNTFFALICSAFIAASAGVVCADDVSPVTLSVNEAAVEGDKAPVIINNVTYVPFRILFDALEAEYSWDNENKCITAEKNDIVVKLWINNKEYHVNDEEKYTENAPLIIDGSTYIPVRTVAEAFKLEISWNDASRNVNISDDSITTQTTTESTTESSTKETTETTTKRDPNMSPVDGVNKNIFKKVTDDLAKSAKSYTLGDFDNCARFKKAAIDKMYETWDSMVKTPEEERFVSAAKSAHSSLESAYRGFDSTYDNNKKYSGAANIIRDYLNKARMTVRSFSDIKESGDLSAKISAFRDAYADMNDDLSKLRGRYE